MAVTQIGFNVSKLNNITFPEFNSSRTVQEWVSEIPRIANETTNYLYGWVSLLILFVVQYVTMSENIGTGGFGYSEFKNLAIVSGIVCIFGYILVMAGLIRNFAPIGVFSGLFLLGSISILYVENKPQT